jgi:hypothetical protein
MKYRLKHGDDGLSGRANFPIETGGPRSHCLVGWFKGLPLFKNPGKAALLLAGISVARMRLDHSQLMALLAGMDWKRFVRPRSGDRC